VGRRLRVVFHCPSILSGLSRTIDGRDGRQTEGVRAIADLSVACPRLYATEGLSRCSRPRSIRK
jgi:hypothetical protein